MDGPRGVQHKQWIDLEENPNSLLSPDQKQGKNDVKNGSKTLWSWTDSGHGPKSEKPTTWKNQAPPGGSPWS